MKLHHLIHQTINNTHPICALREIAYLLRKAEPSTENSQQEIDALKAQWALLSTEISVILFQSVHYPHLMDRFNDVMNLATDKNRIRSIIETVNCCTHCNHVYGKFFSSLIQEQENCVGSPLLYANDVALQKGFKQQDIDHIRRHYNGEIPLPAHTLHTMLKETFA